MFHLKHYANVLRDKTEQTTAYNEYFSQNFHTLCT